MAPPKRRRIAEPFLAVAASDDGGGRARARAIMRSLAEQWRAEKYCDLTIQIVEREDSAASQSTAGARTNREGRSGSRRSRSATAATATAGGSAEADGVAEGKMSKVVATFPVHRSVLDSGSGRLRELLRALDKNHPPGGGSAASSEPVLQLDRAEAEPAALRSLLEWLYTGRFAVGSMAEASDVLHLAVRYRCLGVLDAAADVLIEETLRRRSVGPDCWTLADDLKDLLEEERRVISPKKKSISLWGARRLDDDDDSSASDDDDDDDGDDETTLPAYNLDRTLRKLDRLAKEAMLTVEENFDKLAENGLVQKLSFEQLKEVLGSDDLIIGTEDELFNAVVSWIEGHDDDGDGDDESMPSSKDIGELFSLLRYGLMSESFVEDDVLEEPIFASSSAGKKALKVGRDHLKKCTQSDQTRQRVKRIASWSELKAMPLSEEVSVTKCKRDLGEEMWYGGRPGNRAVRAGKVENVSGFGYDYGQEPKFERSQPIDMAGDTFCLDVAETGRFGEGSGFDDKFQALDFTWGSTWCEHFDDTSILLPYEVLRRPAKYIVTPKKEEEKAKDTAAANRFAAAALDRVKKGKAEAKKRALSSKRLN